MEGEGVGAEVAAMAPVMEEAAAVEAAAARAPEMVVVEAATARVEGMARVAVAAMTGAVPIAGIAHRPRVKMICNFSRKPVFRQCSP